MCKPLEAAGGVVQGTMYSVSVIHDYNICLFLTKFKKKMWHELRMFFLFL